MEKYITNLVDDYRYEGTLYGLPDWITTHVLAYRTDIFEQESLDPPETWDDLLAVCEQLSGSSRVFSHFLPGQKGRRPGQYLQLSADQQRRLVL